MCENSEEHEKFHIDQPKLIVNNLTRQLSDTTPKTPTSSSSSINLASYIIKKKKLGKYTHIKPKIDIGRIKTPPDNAGHKTHEEDNVFTSVYAATDKEMDANYSLPINPIMSEPSCTLIEQQEKLDQQQASENYIRNEIEATHKKKKQKHSAEKMDLGNESEFHSPKKTTKIGPLKPSSVGRG